MESTTSCYISDKEKCAGQQNFVCSTKTIAEYSKQAIYEHDYSRNKMETNEENISSIASRHNSTFDSSSVDNEEVLIKVESDLITLESQNDIIGERFGEELQHKSGTVPEEHIEVEWVQNNQPIQCDLCAEVYFSHILFIEHLYNHIHQLKAESSIPKRLAGQNEEKSENQTGLRWLIPIKPVMVDAECQTIKRKVTLPFKAQCNYCSQPFDSLVELKTHKANHSGGPRPYSCYQCNRTFIDEEHKITHIKMFHSDQCCYICEDCGRSFTRKYRLVTHRRIHSAEKPFSCELCDKSYRDRDNLVKHGKIHLNDVTRKCNICQIEFKNDYFLNKHKEETHVEVKHWCRLCGEGFSDEADLQKHRKMQHQTKRFSCSTCGKQFATQDELTTHTQSHSKDSCDESTTEKEDNSHVEAGENKQNIESARSKSPFKCDKCTLSFRTTAQYRKHLQTHSKQKLYACKHCHVTYADKVTLSKHLSADHNGGKFKKTLPKPMKKAGSTVSDDPWALPYHCNICPKSFNRPYRLKNHMNRHTSARPYHCTHCIMVFPDRDLLTKHHNRMHPELEISIAYGCEVCNKQYPSEVELNEHMSVHMNTNQSPTETSELNQSTENQISNISISNTSMMKISRLASKGTAHFSKRYKHDKVLFKASPSPKPICQYCKQVFRNRTRLQTHIRLRHTGERPIACKFCAWRTADKWLLKKHILKCHPEVTDVKVHCCEVCNESFGSSLELNTHVAAAHYTAGLPSVNKGITVSRTGVLSESQVIQDDSHASAEITSAIRSIEPTNANQPYQNQSPVQFDQHTDTTTSSSQHPIATTVSSGVPHPPLPPPKRPPVYPKLAHTCDYCGKYFSRPYRLREHRRVHTGERPHVCPYCLKRYAIRDELTKHLKVCGSGGQTSQFGLHVCPHCKKSCPGKDAIIKHLKVCGSETILVSPSQKTSKEESNVGGSRIIVSSSAQQMVESSRTEIQQTVESSSTENQIVHAVYVENLNAKNADDGRPADLSGIVELLVEENQVEEEITPADSTAEGSTGETSSVQSPHPDNKSMDAPADQGPVSLKQKVHPSAVLYVSQPQSSSSLRICQYCGKHFKKTSSLRDHIRTHTGEKPFSCSQCSDRYPTRQKLLDHTRRVHQGIKPPRRHSCDICNEKFTIPKYLKAHMRRHGTEGHYQCHYCGEGFIYKGNLIQHLKDHGDNPTYQCHTCGMVQKDYPRLIRHIRAHSKEKPYSCHICGRDYSYLPYFYVHMQSHQKDIGQATSITTQPAIEIPSEVLELRPTSDPSQYPHICDVCGKGFKLAFKMREHRRIHTGVKPFSCPHCKKPFAAAEQLTKHLRWVHLDSRSASHII